MQSDNRINLFFIKSLPLKSKGILLDRQATARAKVNFHPGQGSVFPIVVAVRITAHAMGGIAETEFASALIVATACPELCAVES